jgi:hypothetical protein
MPLLLSMAIFYIKLLVEIYAKAHWELLLNPQIQTLIIFWLLADYQILFFSLVLIQIPLGIIMVSPILQGILFNN